MSEATAKALIFSDNSDVRQTIINGVGARASKDSPRLEWFEAATLPGVNVLMDEHEFALIVLDAEVQKHGGMGVASELRDTRDSVPPMIILTARQQDAWLANWAGAAEIIAAPYEPLTVQETVARVLGTR